MDVSSAKSFVIDGKFLLRSLIYIKKQPDNSDLSEVMDQHLLGDYELSYSEEVIPSGYKAQRWRIQKC